MDDARIRELRDEVLAELRGADARDVDSLETRVARLEAAVRALQAGGAAAPVAVATATVATVSRAVVHPALRLLDVPSGCDRCVLEPDKPCDKSGTCRTLGY